jgi:hypothetical protein
MNIKQVRRCKKNIPNILNNDDEDDKQRKLNSKTNHHKKKNKVERNQITHEKEKIKN